MRYSLKRHDFGHAVGSFLQDKSLSRNHKKNRFFPTDAMLAAHAASVFLHRKATRFTRRMSRQPISRFFLFLFVFSFSPLYLLLSSIRAHSCSLSFLRIFFMRFAAYPCLSPYTSSLFFLKTAVSVAQGTLRQFCFPNIENPSEKSFIPPEAPYMEKNLTHGSVFKTLLSFSLPFFLSYFLQTLYGMADLFIIGQFNDVACTTAVSIGSQVMHMLTVMIVGLAMGSTVQIGKSVGAQKKEETETAIGNTVTLFMSLSVVTAAVLILLVKPITTAMSTPVEAVNGTVAYLTICFIGIPFITAYNIVSSIFRGMGDSESPMWFIAVACAANIALDYLFIGVLKLGPAGAALGTTLSQTVSVIVSLCIIRKKGLGLTIKKSHFRPRKAIMCRLLYVGIPIAVQDGFIQIAFIVITVIANQRGLNDAAAVGIVEKLIGILFLVPSSMLSSVSALGAQNIGAGRDDRAKKTLGYALLITVSFGMLSVIVMQLKAEFFLSLFSKDNADVVRLGAQYMRGYVWDCILAGIHFCFSGYFCACGLSGFSFLHNFISIVCARIPLVYLASKRFADTLFPMGLATVTGSLLSSILCVCMFLYIQKRKTGIGAPSVKK